MPVGRERTGYFAPTRRH